MADFTGIHAVTETLRRLLADRMVQAATVNVRTAALDVDLAGDVPYVNLFLYRVSENAELKNQDLPGRAPAMALGHPPLSLDLHYLLTAAGDDLDDDRPAHQLLGDAMLVLHDHPIIAKDDPLLHPALQHEVELLKVTMEPVDIDELSKIWTASTSALRLSATYRVTVVQLESTLPRRIPKPVLEPPAAGPRVLAVPLDRPRITSLAVVRPPATDEEPFAYARVGDLLVVRGSSFLPGTRVLLADVDATAAVQPSATGSRLAVEVPDDPGLQPGVQRLQLVRDIDVGTHDVPLLRSNVAAFVLVPGVTALDPASGPVGTALAVEGTRLSGPVGPTYVVIGDRAVVAQPGGDPTEVTAVVPALPLGTHSVSVRVNGAESIEQHTFEVT